MVWTPEQRDAELKRLGEAGLRQRLGEDRWKWVIDTARQQNCDIAAVLRNMPIATLESAIGGQPHNVRPGTVRDSARGQTIETPNPFAGQEKLGDYIVQAEIGRGAMGRVLFAYDVRLQRKAAVKQVIPPATPEDLLRFTQEAQNMAKLKHPNIVEVYATGAREGNPYFAMEYVEGGRSLDKIINELARSSDRWEKTAMLAHKIAQGLVHAHEKQVIHRDLKPANILITPKGEPKIADFGLAKDLQKVDGLTQPGDILGTPTYMSPEQIDGRYGRPSPKSDGYSLGVILYQLITQSPPYIGRSAIELFTQICDTNTPLVAPHVLTPSVPAPLENICLKAMRREPSERYEHMQEFADDLERFLKNEPVLALPESKGRRAIRAMKRNAVPILGAALFATLATGGVLYAVQNARNQSEQLRATQAETRAARAEQDRQSLELKTAQTERESRATVRNTYQREMQKAEQDERWNDALRFGEAALALTPNGSERDVLTSHLREIAGETPIQIMIPEGIQAAYQIDEVLSDSTRQVYPASGVARESSTVKLQRGKSYRLAVSPVHAASYSECFTVKRPDTLTIRNEQEIPGMIFIPRGAHGVYLSRWPVTWGSYLPYLGNGRADPSNPLLPRDTKGPFTTERRAAEEIIDADPITNISPAQTERFLALYQTLLARKGLSGYTARLAELSELESAVVSGYTYPWGGKLTPEMMRTVPEQMRATLPIGRYLTPTNIFTGGSGRDADPRTAVTLSGLHLSNISTIVKDNGNYYAAMSDLSETDPRMHAVIESRAGGAKIPAREISRDSTSPYTGFYVVVVPPN